MIFLHQTVDIGVYFYLVERRIRQIEIETAFRFADGATGNTSLDDGAQQVKRRMHSHQHMPARPIYFNGNVFTDSGQRATLRQDMKVLTGFAIFVAISYCDLPAVLTFDDTGIAGLPPAHGVEYGLVQHETAFSDFYNGCFAGRQIGVFPEQFLGHCAQYSLTVWA